MSVFHVHKFWQSNTISNDLLNVKEKCNIPFRSKFCPLSRSLFSMREVIQFAANKHGVLINKLIKG